MANRNFFSNRLFAMHGKPVLIDCNFVVDSMNGNGLGIRSLKGPCVQAVYMHTTATPAPGNPNPQGSGAPAGGLNLATAGSFGILAYSAITNSASAPSTITGNMGITPDNLSSITGFPPGTVLGTINAANAAAVQAQTDATAAFTAGQTRGLAGTTIAAELGGQTVTPGDYQFTGGAAGISLTSGHSTLTLNGAGVYLFYTASTLTTGASGSTDVPTFAFTGGATAANTTIYWIVGSSATINQAVASASATFYGTIIANTSITVTQGGTVKGRLLALTGAVTLTNATNATGTTLNLPAGGSGASGTIIVQLTDGYRRSLCGFKAIASPTSGLPLQIDNTALTAGTAYIITTLGNSTTATWQALGVPIGLTPQVGMSFIASGTGGSADVSTSRVMAASLAGSGVCSIETVGDPNTAVNPISSANQGYGAYFILQCRDYTGAINAPADGTVISLAFYLNDSSVTVGASQTG